MKCLIVLIVQLNLSLLQIFSKELPTVEVEVYHHNTEFNMNIEKNSFFEKVKHYANQNNYTTLLDNDYLEGLLSRFKISKKIQKII